VKNPKMKIISILGSISFIFLFTVAVIQSNYQEQTAQVSSSTTLNNQKIGWGIKRNTNHEQPDLGSKNKQLMDKYQAMAIGNKEKKYVYLTFDEGYEAGYTPKILEVLKQNEVKATFFITAHFLNTQPDLVKQMIEEGHIVGNHTVNHKSMPDLSNEQIQKEVMELHTAIYQKFNYEMKYIRPPKGEFSERTIQYTNTLGYQTVMWSLAYDDWEEAKQGREEYGKKKVLDNIHPGAIILLHGTSKDNSNILDACIKEIKQMGYEIRSLEEFQR
jgi:peptidoglycan-N-acetylmuramic acid deacetylase